MRIIFMGTPNFAEKSLEAIYNAKHEIIAVVTNPDRPKGRGMKMVASPVKEFAVLKNLTIYQPEKIRKNEEFINTIKALKPDVICVVAYGKILPKEILEIPKLGCINVHGSLLPQYRGAAPIQWSIINGDKVTGITTMYMDAGMDSGDMILQEKTEIGENETTGELWDRLSGIGAKLLVETLKQIEAGTAPRIKQGEEFTIAPMLEKEMSKINWKEKSAKENRIKQYYVKEIKENCIKTLSYTTLKKIVSVEDTMNAVIENYNAENYIEMETSLSIFKNKIEELKEELFNLRFANATGNLEKPSRIKEIRKTIARIKMVIREREINNK